MSWAEVFKINSNMKKPLNEHLRDMKFQSVRIITATGTFTPEKTGLYKVICVGAGGDGDTTSNYVAAGGGGGVAIKTLRLLSTKSYNVTVSSTASFTHDNGSITATAGADGNTSALSSDGGAGGTASGGDYNYTGSNGDDDRGYDTIPLPGSVGVYISDLSRQKSVTRVYGESAIEIPYGDNLLGYGGGACGVAMGSPSSTNRIYLTGQPAAIIIVPLELEE